ncbi:MAG: hypothetical protein U5L04_01645 [Trueperaceae bacterium]|nr:hypothetical protein [Trueperaceae bacterium]
MKLLRYLHNGYQIILSDYLNRIAKTPWLAAASLAFAQYRKWDDTLATFCPIGQSFLAVADGTNTLELNSGLALHNDPSGDAYLGDIQPLFAGANIDVPITDNSDASGDDRIDLVVVQRTVVDGNREQADFKDENTGTVYTDTVDTWREYDVVYDVIEGTPAAAPSAPATPSGWMPVAEVTRVNGSSGVNLADVEDVRPALDGGTTLGFGRILDFIALKDNAALFFGDKDGSYSRIRGDVGQNYRQISLVTDNVGAVPDGAFHLGKLVAWAKLKADELHGNINDDVVVRNAADDDLGAMQAKNVTRAWGLLQWNSGTSTWEWSSNYNMGTITKNSTGNLTLEFINAPPSGDGGIAMITGITGTEWPRHSQASYDNSIGDPKLQVLIYGDDGAGGLTPKDFGSYYITAYWQSE